MPMADYVALHGQAHVELSLNALKDMTSRFSSEFAIRPFLHHHQDRTLDIIAAWIDDKNEHVRRLVSEGTRPRLPWGMRLKSFVEDPKPVLALLEELKDDPSEYVRRSVANNLNDIAKDHGDHVATIAMAWMSDASPDRKRLVRHALRTLIKSGHPMALKALGYGPPKIELETFDIITPRVELGAAVEFAVKLRSRSQSDQPLIIDYAVHHKRADGTTSPKVFKWKTVSLLAGETLAITRRHAIKPITTRRYYSGLHHVEILVNGKGLGREDFHLITP